MKERRRGGYSTGRPGNWISGMRVVEAEAVVMPRKNSLVTNRMGFDFHCHGQSMDGLGRRVI